MRVRGVSVPARMLCVAVALLTGFVAIRVAASGEFRAKGGVVELTPWQAALVAGPLALMAITAAWVAVTGRSD